jgi:hypothetical protein
MARVKPIYQIIDELPTRSITVRVLNALDFLAPGEWENLVGFTETIRAVTGETDDQLIQKIGERAIALYNDRSQGYLRAMSLYQTVDRVDRLAVGPLAMINTAGEQIRWLRFLRRFTPKAEPLQGLDLALKIVAELGAFTLINGIPGDSIGDFVKSLGNYSKESRMRMVALVALDGVLPLGPNFLQSVSNTLSGTKPDELAQNKLYRGIQAYLPGGSEFSTGGGAAKSGVKPAGKPAARSSKYAPPGSKSTRSSSTATRSDASSSTAVSRFSGDTAGHLGFVKETFGQVQDWMSDLVANTKMTRERVAEGLSKTVEVTDTGFDYAAAFLDMSTEYYAHTGAQTLARRLIERAVNEI